MSPALWTGSAYRWVRTARRSAALPLFAAVLAAATLGACGSDDGDDATVDNPPEESPDGLIPVGDGVPGVDDSTIRIGVLSFSSDNLDDVAGEVSGDQNADVTGDFDMDASTKIIIDEINANGGIAGREVVAVPFHVDVSKLTSAQGRDELVQAASATWTEDNDVFAIPALSGDLLLDCATNAGAVVVTPFLSPVNISGERFAEDGDHWYAPNTLSAEHRDEALAQFLLDQGFFGDDLDEVSVALVVEDTEAAAAGAEHGSRPVLEDAGISSILEIRYPDPITSPWANYVLQMQTDKVTHVIFGATSGGAMPGVMLMQAAESQGYRPSWGMASDNVPTALPSLGQLPTEQLSQVLAMGWLPGTDVGDTTPQSEAAERCQTAMVAAGQTAASCEDYLYFLQAALSEASEISPAGLSDAVASLGSSYQSMLTIGGVTSFADGRHDGVSQVRPVRYDEVAKLFAYDGDAVGVTSD